MIRNILLPLTSLLSGLVCLYIDPKTDRARAWIVIAVLGGSAIATGIYGNQDLKDAQTAEDRAKEMLSTSKDTKQDVHGMKDEVDQLVHLLQPQGILSATSVSQITPATVQQSYEADLARREELQLRAQNPSLQPSTIEYFTRELDKDVVKRALQEGGLKFSEAAAKISDDPTNSVWVGDKVPLSDIKFVALTLLRAGVQLKGVRLFNEGSGPKAHLIEIGADRVLDHDPVLTVERIQSMTGVNRDPKGASGASNQS
jgi:hypothetical protein